MTVVNLEKLEKWEISEEGVLILTKRVISSGIV